MNKFYDGFKIRTIGPEGPEVEYLESDFYPELKQIIHQKIMVLISDGKVTPEDIAILFPDDISLQRFFSVDYSADQPWVKSNMRKRGSIVVDTIKKFKGLESPIVFLLLNPEIVENDELLYVGLSRASTFLYVCGNSNSVEYFQNMINSD